MYMYIQRMHQYKCNKPLCIEVINLLLCYLLNDSQESCLLLGNARSIFSLCYNMRFED